MHLLRAALLPGLPRLRTSRHSHPKHRIPHVSLLVVGALMLFWSLFDLQTVIDAIRGAGAKQLILVPNSRGSDVDHWGKYAPNGGSLDSVAALSITDKANNIAFDMHAYQDNPASPTSYVDLVTPVTQWAIKHRKRLFLSECGVVNGAANGPSAISNLLSYLNAHRSVWVGWTAWNLAPYNLTQAGDYTADGPQMAWYTPYLTPNTV